LEILADVPLGEIEADGLNEILADSEALGLWLADILADSEALGD